MANFKEHKRPDSADAFLPDPVEEHKPLREDDAESFAEEFIASATAAEPVQEDARDEVVDEEQGGPFLIEDDSDEPDTVPEPPRMMPARRQPA
jgi:hypothetical protein